MFVSFQDHVISSMIKLQTLEVKWMDKIWHLAYVWYYVQPSLTQSEAKLHVVAFGWTWELTVKIDCSKHTSSVCVSLIVYEVKAFTVFTFHINFNFPAYCKDCTVSMWAIEREMGGSSPVCIRGPFRKWSFNLWVLY